MKHIDEDEYIQRMNTQLNDTRTKEEVTIQTKLQFDKSGNLIRPR